ncbi:S-adenosyl-L-methionine-dependent methyltransferase [Serendipita vermifera]|nr:S-adenosyl-L-methionine-dependent methyltransferase [Serendipita vermifera]
MSTSEAIHSLVQQHYGAIANQSVDGAPGSDAYFNKVAATFGYSASEIDELRGANMGLSCGNPVATSHLREGEVVVDLGSGAGMDVILAAQKVGPTGRVFGIDMTQDMIKLATENAEKRGLKNTKFIHSTIEALPLPSDSVDCVISNCVLNLVPEGSKRATLNEIYRVLKPGGRVSISDIVAKKELPPSVLKDAAAYVGCVAGAIHYTTYESYLREAGFKDILLLDSEADLNVYTAAYEQSNIKGTDTIKGGCCTMDLSTGKGDTTKATCCAPPGKTQENILTADQTARQNQGSLDNVVNSLLNYDLNEFLGSYKIYALKPTEYTK